MKLLVRFGVLRGLFGTGRLSWRMVRDPRVPLFPKLLLAVGIVLIVSPINWIPNFIPILGPMEDLALLGLVLSLFLKSVPAELRSQHEAALAMRRDGQARFEQSGAVMGSRLACVCCPRGL